MLSFTHVMHFLADELSGLDRWRLAFSLVLFRSSDGFFFRHFDVLPKQI
jgi:hypothetical protein